LLGLAAAPAFGESAFHEPNAVLINLTEEDLNLIIRDAFHANGASRIEGARSELSRGISDFRYEAGISDPVLTLGDDGRAKLDLDILEAELSFGSIERKVLARRMRCENAGITVRPQNPVDVTLDLRFAIEDHDLHLVPEEVTLANTNGFRLRKPTRCRNNPLPEFLMWWLGKGRLRRKIERLDHVLLAKARDGAEALTSDDGLLAKHWRFDESQGEVHLYPQSVDTSHGSLLIGLAGSSPVREEAASAAPGWVGDLAGRSFLGLSESFLNFTLRRAFRKLDGRPREPSGGLRKLFRSEAVHTLIPGLRGMSSGESLRLGFTFHATPVIEFAPLDGDRALIRVRLSAVELILWESEGGRERWLGSIDIDSATVAVAPFFNVLGGVSFDTVENDWLLSSRGIEFDEEILAATFQELFFGEMFETRYEPVGRETFEVGKTRFDPRYFSLVGNYLVIGLTGF
jgi:hypothetical protein